MKKSIGVLVMCAAALGFGVAHAHGTPAPNHGGLVQAVGETWLELVVKDGARLIVRAVNAAPCRHEQWSVARQRSRHTAV